jgi:hypothetical protein
MATVMMRLVAMLQGFVSTHIRFCQKGIQLRLLINRSSTCQVDRVRTVLPFLSVS